MNIKNIREKVMLTQEELAKVLGVSFRTIQSWEQGKCEPSLRLKRKVVEFCKQNNIEVV